jgi:transposase
MPLRAQHGKHVPGHTPDVRDAAWLADLLRHGLLRASFIPPVPIRALRELTRSRKTLVRERTSEVNRIQKGDRQLSAASGSEWQRRARLTESPELKQRPAGP